MEKELSLDNVLFDKSLYYIRNAVKMIGVKFFQIVKDGTDLFGIFAVGVKKIFRGNAEILAYIEKSCHRGQSFAILNVVDIARVLTDRKAHIPRGNALLAAQLCKAQRKLLFCHTVSPL